MSNHIPIENPYAGKPREELVNINFWISPEDHKYLTAIYPYQGRWQNVCATLIKGVVNELKRRSVTVWDPTTDAIVSAIVVGGMGRTSVGTVTENRPDPGPDVPGATGGAREASTDAPRVPAEPISSTGGGRRKGPQANSGRQTRSRSEGHTK